MTYQNGQIPYPALSTISPDTQLLNPTANAYVALRIMGTLDGIIIKPAAGVGSGYRSLTVQKMYWDASHGNRSAAEKVGLNPNSSVSVAAPGYSSHGYGTRIDLLFNGSSKPARSHLILAERFGFIREFGADDPNHFMHDGRTAINGPSHADQVRVIATYLNSRHLGKTSTCSQDGDDSNAPKYWWMVQQAGRIDGIYPKPFKIDGIPGPKTYATRNHYWSVLSRA